MPERNTNPVEDTPVGWSYNNPFLLPGFLVLILINPTLLVVFVALVSLKGLSWSVILVTVGLSSAFWIPYLLAQKWLGKVGAMTLLGMLTYLFTALGVIFGLVWGIVWIAND